MAHRLTFRQLLLSVLALRYDRSQKEIGIAAGIPQKRVNQYLRRGEINEEAFQRLLAAVDCPPAAVRVVTACLQDLDALEHGSALTADELAEVEEAALSAARLTREAMTEAALLSRYQRPPTGYPEAEDLDSSRERAGELWGRLKGLPQETRLAVVQVAEEFQCWALSERVCEESVKEVSRKVERASDLATLAEAIAARVQGPEEWLRCLRSYAAAHTANSLRVAGELPAAEAALAEAEALWRSGADPLGVLDPGRLLNLRAALCRDQRRLDEALALLDDAAAVGRRPELALIQKGFTLEVMGEYSRAIATLLDAYPLVDQDAEPRLGNVLRINLAFNLCHVGRYDEATALLAEARPIAAGLGDEIDLIRMTWLEGRIAAGQGHSAMALRALGKARRDFDHRGMAADAALALLEEAVLLLDEGQTAAVKALSRELTRILGSKGVYREALAAIRLFQQAAEREEATSDLASRVLHYLFRARYDQGLQFSE